MPSQPDLTLAYKLSPQLRPVDSAEELAAAKALIASLTAELAALKGVTPEEVTKEQEQAALPVAESPLEVPAEELTVEVPAVTQEEAQFFASKEGSKFFPIEKLETTKIKPENMVFFRTEQDALAASYTA